MRRLLAAALLVTAAATALPAHAETSCVGGNAAVCYQVAECARICRVHVIVEGRCIDHPGCEYINSIYVDSDRVSR
ncbi:MAG TPA: hypothetical protein VFQ85_09745 [Mycobacteriales bacterium]|jgi:hypothetical protein|nr:hypothetical protein [Mycobacteriales bacterium]